jgi:hypothetical protein
VNFGCGLAGCCFYGGGCCAVLGRIGFFVPLCQADSKHMSPLHRATIACLVFADFCLAMGLDAFFGGICCLFLSEPANLPVNFIAPFLIFWPLVYDDSSMIPRHWNLFA